MKHGLLLRGLDLIQLFTLLFSLLVLNIFFDSIKRGLNLKFNDIDSNALSYFTEFIKILIVAY